MAYEKGPVDTSHKASKALLKQQMIQMTNKELVLIDRLGEMAQEDLFKFVKQAENDTALQKKIFSCKNASEITSIAKGLGISLTFEELKKASRDLAASFWPWAGVSRNYRREWFLIGRTEADKKEDLN